MDILIVDDSHLLRELYLDIVEEYIFKNHLKGQAHVANEGREALGMFRKQIYAAVITDYQMPQMNGVELIIEMRRRGYSSPTLLHSGKNKEDIGDLSKLGHVVFMSKSSDDNYIVDFLKRVHRGEFPDGIEKLI